MLAKRFQYLCVWCSLSFILNFRIPLNKQNTEEYRQQEARASKLASEIESASHHKSRAALENGDEEDRYSAVIRPADNSNNNSNNTNNNNNNNNFRYEHRNFDNIYV